MTGQSSERLGSEPLGRPDGRWEIWAQLWRDKLLAAWTPPATPRSIWPATIAAVFISVVFLTLPMAPPDLGIDPAWSAVLNYANEQHLQFGKDIVFTYGPLGFLLAPYYFAHSASTVVLVNAAFCFQIALGLCLTAWRLGWAWRIGLLGIFVLESANVELRADLGFEVGFLCWGLLCMLEEGRRRKFCATSLVVLAAFAALTKVTYLFVGGFSLCAVALSIRLSGRRWVGMLMLAGFGLTLVLGWMACRQALANLGTFLLDGFLIARDYDQASGMEGLPMLRAEAFLVGAVGLATVVIGTLTALASLDREGRWRRVILFGWLAGLLFLVWKHSMVRVDRSHTAELLVFTPVLAFALETLPSSQHKLRQIARVLALGCCALSFWVLESAFLPGLKTTLSEPFHQFVYHANCIFSPADWSRLMEPALAERQREAQLPKLRKLIGDATVDVFGSLQAHALLNKLNYRPRPVFQSYAAYNPRLARLNEEFYLSDRAPNYVLFDLFAVEHRFPTLNDGPALRSLLTNYEPVAAEDVFLLLKRKSSEPARLTLLSEGIFKTRDRLDLGKYPDDDLWLEFEVTPTVAGRLMTFLVRPPPLRLSVWMDGPTGLKRLVRRRAVPSLLKTGFVGSPCLLNSEDVRDLYTAERIVRASAYSLEPDPGSEQMWQQTVRFRLYKIENRLGRCVSRELGPILKLERRGPVGSERRAEP